MLWVPRASSQTDPAARAISAGVGARRDLVRILEGHGPALLLEQRPELPELPLDRGQSLVERAHLGTQVGARLDRGRAQPLGLAPQIAELVVEDDLEEAAGHPAQRRQHARENALEREAAVIAGSGAIHVDRKRPAF